MKIRFKSRGYQDTGNEGFIDWIKSFFGDTVANMRKAYRECFDSKPSVDVSVDKTLATKPMGNENASLIITGLCLTAAVGIYIAKYIQEYFAAVNTRKAPKGISVYDKICEKLKNNGESKTTLEDIHIVDIAHKYSGYAAISMDINDKVLPKKYWNDKNSSLFIEKPFIYDIEDLNLLTRNGYDIKSWSYAHSVIEVIQMITDKGMVTVNQNVIKNALSGVSVLYGDMLASNSKYIAFSRLKKILDGSLVPADMYFPIDLYEEFSYYWIKFDGNKKYTYGLASCPYKRGNEYANAVYGEITSLPIEAINSALVKNNLSYWDWYGCLFKSGEDRGYLSKFFKQFNVDPKDVYGYKLFVLIANHLARSKGLYNGPELTNENYELLKEVIVDLTCSYYIDVTKRRLYKLNSCFEDTTKLILG